MTDVREVTVTVRPMWPIVQKFSGKVLTFDAEIEGRRAPFSIWFPITDRRLARRISRKTGKRFKCRDGVCVFREVLHPRKLTSNIPPMTQAVEEARIKLNALVPGILPMGGITITGEWNP